MHAIEARAITEEAWFFKQIKREAHSGKDNTMLDFVDRATAAATKITLEDKGYTCGRIKQHSSMMGNDITMEVRW